MAEDQPKQPPQPRHNCLAKGDKAADLKVQLSHYLEKGLQHADNHGLFTVIPLATRILDGTRQICLKAA
jgi:hypothetical protein